MANEKPYFYRIVAADFLAAIVQIPEGQHREWVYQFALDLVNGVGSSDYAKKVISEVQIYRKQQAENGRNRWKDKEERQKRVAKRATSEPIGSHEGRKGNSSNSNNNRSNNNSSTEAEAETKDLKEEKILSGKPDAERRSYPYQQILDEMNGILSTKFRNTETFKKLIRARVNEGFTPEDFGLVCRKKFADWGSDLKMMQYLRPETLFGSKMNDYLGSLATGPPVGERERVNYAAGQSFIKGGDNIWSNRTE